MFKKIIYRYSLRKRYSAILADTKKHVSELSERIGERSLACHDNLNAAADYISETFKSFGLKVCEEVFTVEGKTVRNIYADIAGIKSKDIILIGAHYDTVENSRGANDNASGISALLEICRLMSGKTPKNTLRFTAFTLEEPPFFSTDKMGSSVHASNCCKSGKDITLMINLDMLGYAGMFTKQNFPDDNMKEIYPSRGNFLSIVSLPSCVKAVDICAKIFNRHSPKTIISAALPASYGGIAESDHISFIRNGIPAVLFTDTGILRNPNYHSPNDSSDTINFKFLSENVYSIYKVIKELSYRNLRPLRKNLFRI
ncbi:MAG TPA: M28 family peptidase [Spirochaetota bacterium]|nr:M28 family peptidase [Spirochaetota bacterium]HOH36687.1 M28 family peptidase [Spirochaetota bacterium]HPY01592.1 M28 family peptidase [Spirochaetota bacterium]HQA51683.1 M28 family peptidase [Spirochaetota bacterium]